MQVPELPAGNLLQNPWFTDGLTGWIDADGDDWEISIKASNPSPGGANTAARFSKRIQYRWGLGPGCDEDGEQGTLYQVVTADPLKLQLAFSAWYVVDVGANAWVDIYGGETAEGPWIHFWRPLNTPIADRTWHNTDAQIANLAVGFPYYKIELNGVCDGSGAKFTGVYLGVTP